MRPQQNPGYAEALMLIKLRRRRAKEALDKFAKRFGEISNSPFPGTEVILDYLTNTVYALELLLKVMADDWCDGRSRFGHDVAAMYQEIFGRPHPTPEFMDTLKAAILDQKFIYAPADGLMDRIPDLEELWLELSAEFDRRDFMRDITFRSELTLPANFVEYLRRNFRRYYRGEQRLFRPYLPREARIDEIQCHIESLQNELRRLKGDEDSPEENPREFGDRIAEEHRRRAEAAESTFAHNIHFHGGQFTIGEGTIGKVLPGFLDEP